VALTWQQADIHPFGDKVAEIDCSVSTIAVARMSADSRYTYRVFLIFPRLSVRVSVLLVVTNRDRKQNVTT
jgi:hypothetical protein